MEGPICTRPISMTSFADLEEGQAQLHKRRGVGTVEGNEVQDVGRGQIVPNLVNFTKGPGLYLVKDS